MSLKVTIKQRLIVFHKANQWNSIWQQIIKDHGNKVLISFVLKRDLGFTVRNHTTWNIGHNDRIYSNHEVHLDFFNDSAQSWFQLRYLKFD